MTEWTDKRNQHVCMLRALLARELRWQNQSNDEDRTDVIAAFDFAISRLDGLPEHWIIDESEGKGQSSY